MEWLKQYLKDNPQIALSVPAFLCFIQFISSLFGAVRSGVFNNDTLNQLLSTADGFETVILGIIMIVLRNKKK